ncbi:hypothetical protein PG993_011760 [Apiospora rasikravindrae]|uniref:Mitochondrial adapter protein MCP1 transmembrane domain-containing protein n=1 Tax=Apiospora rasikravindrae TaxID=990691 RepID=A0ABR1S0K1_9PEZI
MDDRYSTRTLNPKASQETLMSLLQLDPSPMADNASIYEKELPPLPEEQMESSRSTIRSRGTSNSSQSLGLSGTAHGPTYYLTRIQRYSSYTFALFAGMHVANTSIFPLVYRSVPYSEPFLLMAREVYQTRFSEPLLVALPILAHITSGVAIRLIRRSHNLQRYGGATPGMYALHRSKTSNSTSSSSSSNSNGWPMLSYTAISGYVLAPVLASHIFMNRVLPLMVEGDSSNIGLQYVAHGFARHGPPSWVAYGALITIGVGHMVWGGAKWMGIAPPPGWRRTTVDKQLRKTRSRYWWTINGVALAGIALWTAGGLGVVARWGATEGWLGKVYDSIYAQIPLWLGKVYDSIHAQIPL